MWTRCVVEYAGSKQRKSPKSSLTVHQISEKEYVKQCKIVDDFICNN